MCLILRGDLSAFEKGFLIEVMLFLNWISEFIDQPHILEKFVDYLLLFAVQR